MAMPANTAPPATMEIAAKNASVPMASVTQVKMGKAVAAKLAGAVPAVMYATVHTTEAVAKTNVLKLITKYAMADNVLMVLPAPGASAKLAGPTLAPVATIATAPTLAVAAKMNAPK